MLTVAVVIVVLAVAVVPLLVGKPPAGGVGMAATIMRWAGMGGPR